MINILGCFLVCMLVSLMVIQGMWLLEHEIIYVLNLLNSIRFFSHNTASVILLLVENKKSCFSSFLPTIAVVWFLLIWWMLRCISVFQLAFLWFWCFSDLYTYLPLGFLLNDLPTYIHCLFFCWGFLFFSYHLQLINIIY